MGAAPLLTVMRDGQEIQSVPISSETAIGRGEGCVIRLEGRAISRMHAVLKPTSEGVQVEQKSSFSPLLVNGAQCAQALLKEGDVISIGPYLLRLTAEKTQSEPLSDSLSLGPSSDSSSFSGLSMPNEQLEEKVEEPDEEPSEKLPEKLDEELNEEPLVDEGGVTQIVLESRLKARLVFPSGGAQVPVLEINKDEISLGRGKKCDVVLEDNRASRKHAVIRRKGPGFVIRDLESGNGTFVNNIRITEQEITGDEILRIGEVEFRLEVLDEAYADRQKDFLSVAQEEAPASGVEGVELVKSGDPASVSAPGFSENLALPHHFQQQPDVPMVGSDLSSVPGITGIPDSSKKGQAPLLPFLKKISALPPLQRYLVLGVIIAGLWFLLMDEDPESVKKTTIKKGEQKKVAAASSSGAPIPLAFHNLSEEQKRFVESQHALAFEHYKNKEYDKALYEVQKIFALVPDYKDSKEIARYAQEGKRKLQAIEEERRKKEEEAQLKARLDQMIEETREKMIKKQYSEARDLMSQILTVDPENAQVAKWKAEIQEYESSLRDEAEKNRVRLMLEEQLSATFKEAKSYQSKGKCYSAISIYEKMIQTLVDANGMHDPKLLRLAKRSIHACKVWIAKRREPLLQAAKQKEDAGDLPSAYKLYEKATIADPHHRAGFEGMSRIRGVLHDRAKLAYTEAVLAESYSDFATAKRKFKECLEVAPREDIYLKRAESKLSHYFRKDFDEGQP